MAVLGHYWCNAWALLGQSWGTTRGEYWGTLLLGTIEGHYRGHDWGADGVHHCGSTVGQHWSCEVHIWGLQWGCSGAVLGQLWASSGPVLRRRWPSVVAVWGRRNGGNPQLLCWAFR